MWLFLPDGFVSVVTDYTNPQNLHVRGRLPGDIERVMALPQSCVTETPGADYRFRVSLSRARVAESLQEHVMNMDYTNVKDAIARRYEDPLVAGAMHAIHDEMAVLQDRVADGFSFWED